jgi:cellulose synthase operon protein C
MLAAIGALATGLAWGQTPDEFRLLRKHGQRTDSDQCYLMLTQSGDPYLRAEGDWGVQMYQDANNEFRAAVARSDGNAMYRVRWGLLLHERFNNKDADDLFKEALQRDAKYAPAYLGMALVSADGFDSKAVEYATKAVALDPKLVEAHELLASLALEDSDTAEAVKEADAAIQMSPDALDGMAIRAAVELLADRSPDTWLRKIYQVNSTYGQAYALIAYHLVLNRRYEDGIAYYRKALDIDPKLWSARSQLGINLMRLGQENEPLQQLELCYQNGFRNEATVNSLRLLDSYKNFVTFRDDTTILRLQKKEADLLRPYVGDLLHRAMATYEKKYKMKLSGPVQVEVYPDHEDFAVRTLGMPGLGALGVTFGNVVAMDSPSGRKPGSFHWGSTLWHEMSHVYILSATNHRVPRWFTEGLAVHEETQANPEWGDRVTPEILLALRDKKLLPIAQLDSGFVRPQYADQVVVSYFQAGRICDYIQSRWGDDKLLDMVHSFAEIKTTPDVIRENLGMSPEQFDKEFLAWLDKDQDLGKVAANFDMWRTQIKELAERAKDKNYEGVLKLGPVVEQLYPDYIYAANAYEFVAQADLATGNKPAAMAALTDYEKRGGREPGTLKELSSLEEESGDLKAAAETLDRINYIYPVNDEELHHHLGDLWLAQKNYDGAIREYGAVLALNTLDKASAQFDLANAYYAAGQRNQAQDHVLASLEAAPGYRPAQKLLLELQDSEKGK